LVKSGFASLGLGVRMVVSQGMSADRQPGWTLRWPARGVGLDWRRSLGKGMSGRAYKLGLGYAWRVKGWLPGGGIG